MLRKVNKILDIYDNTRDTNYISFKQEEVTSHIDRLSLYYPFQNMIGRKHDSLLYYAHRIINKTQSSLHLYRTIPAAVGFGSQFYDITDDFARWIVESQEEWWPIFKNTVCADEMFFQTLFIYFQKTIFQ